MTAELLVRLLLLATVRLRSHTRSVSLFEKRSLVLALEADQKPALYFGNNAGTGSAGYDELDAARTEGMSSASAVPSSDQTEVSFLLVSSRNDLELFEC